MGILGVKDPLREVTPYFNDLDKRRREVGTRTFYLNNPVQNGSSVEALNLVLKFPVIFKWRLH